MAQENTASQQIYDLLVTRDFDPKSLDAMGKPTVNPSEADLFSFNFSTNGNEYGTVVVLINGDNDLEVYYGDNLGKGMDPGDKGDWYDFLAMLRQTAKRNLLTFSLNNMNKLKYQMATMAGISESLVMEAWKAQGKSKSYSNQPGKAKVVIQHSRAIGEGEQRFRNIAALFVENAQGERFRMPFESIAGAKAMARHVSEGGTPYDAFGQYISETINEIGTLGKFVRASRSNAFAQNEQALEIVEDAVKHYADLKRKAKKMIGKRGYKEIFAAYDPAVATELDETIENVREVFVNSAVDSRIEEALPILAKIKEKTMRESDIFEQWADGLMEGTWQLPSESEETFAKFTELMAKPIKAGPGGEYASELLYDIFGDDTLFDEIGELGDKDPEADVRDLIRARAQELEVVMPEEAAEGVNEDPTQEEPASGYEAGQARGAAGKERSLEMGLGGQDVVKTAGGSDIEEAEEELSMCCDAPISDGPGDAEGRCTSCDEVVRVEEGVDNFVNPNDQDGTDNEKPVDMMAQDDLDSEDMTEDDNDYMSADELKRELISDLNHLYDQASTNDFTDNDHILDEMGDYFKDMHANADDVTLDVYKMARDLVDAEPAEVIQFAEKGIKALGGIIEDAQMSDMRRLSGQVVEKKHVTTEIQDIDTGKEALKAERDPMLERILYLAKG